MLLYNSLTNKKEELLIKSQKVNLYICGPTVYNYIHIGNARPLINFDVLHRVLKLYNYKVNYIHNFTDIDDKIIAKAHEKKINEIELATYHMQAYNNDIKNLRILKPTMQPKVSDSIPQIIKFIEKLVIQKDAYVVNGNVYFRTTKHLDQYGKISNLKIDDLSNDDLNNSEKENPRDFSLWKKTDFGMNWKSPWSDGRPGWHTECVVFNDEIFNSETIDIHGGGVDLKFPHHENERIQWIAANKKPLAKFWIHNGQVMLKNTKMSKSLGNTLLLKDVREQHGVMALKYIILNSHYRGPINVTEETFTNAKIIINKWKNNLQKIQNYLQTKNLYNTNSIDWISCTDISWVTFLKYLNDDLNTANAIMVIDDIIKKIQNIKDNSIINTKFLIINKMLETLGLLLDIQILTNNDIVLLNEWNELKDNKNYKEADALRSLLAEKGIL